MKKLVIVGLIVGCLGCAALFKGTNDEVQFTSQPPGAELYVNGVLKGYTPIELRLQSKKAYDVEFRMSGYQPVVASISSRVGAGWVILDILGGLIPIVIDAATGAWYGLDTNHVNAVFQTRQRENLFETTAFEFDTRLPNFRAANPQASEYSDTEIVNMFQEKFPKLRNKPVNEIIRMIEAKYAPKN